MFESEVHQGATYRLASLYERRRSWHLWAAVLGVLWFLPLHMLGWWMQQQGLVDALFNRTLFWCMLPYALVVRWLYKTTHVPAVEQRTMLLLSTQLPFLLLLLGLALLQQPYSRRAVLLAAGITGVWFWLSGRLSRRLNRLELVVLEPSAQLELDAQLAGNTHRLNTQFSLLPWSDASVAPPACDGVLLSAGAELNEVQQQQLALLKQRHVRLYSTATLVELLTGRMGQSVMSNPLWQPEGNPAYDMAKRWMDLLVVLLTAPAWVPLGALVALAVKLDSAGPAVFSQWRTGQHGRPFRIYKFRTMVVQENAAAQFAKVNDSRITRIGHFLRMSRLDEIPQLVNVLLGHMSLIGPRPEQHTFVQDFAVSIPSYPYRHLVRPGITGWAQVMQGYAASTEETTVKLSYDLYYVNHYSLALDLLIVVKTIKTMLTGFGAR